MNEREHVCKGNAISVHGFNLKFTLVISLAKSDYEAKHGKRSKDKKIS